MHLAPHQNQATIFLVCTEDELGKLPPITHRSDLSSGEWLVEMERNVANLVALRLLGFKESNYG